MASKRPGFARVDTDLNAVPLETLDSNGNSPPRKKQLSEEDGSSAKDVKADVAEVAEGGIYDVERDDHFGKAEVVTTAKDVVTRKLVALCHIAKETDNLYRCSAR